MFNCVLLKSKLVLNVALNCRLSAQKLCLYLRMSIFYAATRINLVLLLEFIQDHVQNMTGKTPAALISTVSRLPEASAGEVPSGMRIHTFPPRGKIRRLTLLCVFISGTTLLYPRHLFFGVAKHHPLCSALTREQQLPVGVMLFPPFLQRGAEQLPNFPVQ